MNAEAIGGYFELEHQLACKEYHQDPMRFQSARAAFLALLRETRPTAVRVPWYICDSMLEPLIVNNIYIHRYGIAEDFFPESMECRENEYFLYVNYFGLNDNNVSRLLKQIEPGKVIIDHSQAFFSMPTHAMATLYSPRKFFGVPDGGYLFTTRSVARPERRDERSLGRAIPLLKRLAFDAEAGFEDYVAAEAGLSGQDPQVMSLLTQRLLGSIDYDAVKKRRVENFRTFHEILGSLNQLSFNFSSEQVPHCYPFSGAPAMARQVLMQSRIYTPCYWKDVSENTAAPKFERHIAATTLFLPCDQRWSSEKIAWTAEILLGILSRK